MSDQITYDNKADLIVDTTIDDIFKVSASDMNEIKNVVNSHADVIDELNAPEKWLLVGTTAPTDGRRVWFSKGKNLLDYNSFVKGRINSSTGQIEYANNVSSVTITSNSITYTSTQAWNNGVTSGFIPIKQGEYIYKIKNASLKVFVYIDYYDSSYNFISRYGDKIINADEETTWLINFTNTSAKYIRLHYEMGFANTITLTEAQLEQGTTATTYEPYVEKSINVDDELWYKKGGFVDISDTQPINGASLWVQPTTENLLDYRNFQTKTSNGINIVNNHDGTFIVNGTASADVSEVVSDVFIPMSGTWRMLGCPSGGSSSTYMLSAYVGYWGGGSPNIDTGSGTNITYTGNVKVRLYIKSGTTCNNLVFKPMLTTNTSATINDFAPKGPNLYALINGQYQVI